jgi:lipopolysaccharide export LptBFGC system permease protein LptF
MDIRGLSLTAGILAVAVVLVSVLQAYGNSVRDFIKPFLKPAVFFSLLPFLVLLVIAIYFLISHYLGKLHK